MKRVVLLCVGLVLPACGEEFRDEGFGVLDLAPVFGGGSSANPEGTLPEQIRPQAGFIDSVPAEYYDFGEVPTIRKPSTGEPTAARAQPMYFFYTKAGFPLLANPVLEARTGADRIPGGRAVSNVNPIDFCTRPGAVPTVCERQNEAQRERPYPIRDRDLLIDPYRKVADYQRPIIDVSPADVTAARPLYTGLWEVVEVTVPDGYRPDDVKSWPTLQRALDNGGFKRRTTGKVINCPLVDERTIVPTGVTARDVPHPLIEVWYRRKLTFCFLANGWETLGTPARQLLFAGAESDPDRVQTFDVATLNLGSEAKPVTALIVPVDRAYTPRVSVNSLGETIETPYRLTDHIVTKAKARRTNADAPGYSPIRWMFDVAVSAEFDGIEFTTGQKPEPQSVDAVDPAITQPWQPLTAHNLALRGTAVPCGYPNTASGGAKRCVRPGGTDGRDDPVCGPLGQECNTRTCFCDAPLVGLGQLCAPGLARCKTDLDVGPDDATPRGYQCYPLGGGHCYPACNPTLANTYSKQNENTPKVTRFLDSRCFAAPGFLCLRYGSTQNRPNGLCLKFCDQNQTIPQTLIPDPQQCVVDVPAPRDPMSTLNLNEGQVCEEFGACLWPDSYTR